MCFWRDIVVMWGKSRYNQFRCTSGTRRGFDSKALRWEVVDSQGVFLFHNYRFSLSWVFRIFKQDVHQPYIILTPNPISSDLYKALLSSHFLCFFLKQSNPLPWVSPLQKRYWPKFHKKKGPKTSFISEKYNSTYKGSYKKKNPMTHFLFGHFL